MAVPAADWDVGEDVVRGLLRAQCPHLADQVLVLAGEGFDNVVWRIGQDLAARIPRHAAGVSLTVNEQHWLPVLAPRLPFPVPVPLECGGPVPGVFDHPWSVVAWFDGLPAGVAPPAEDQAVPLGRFLRALHEPAPAAAPHNPYRGVPLADRRDDVLGWLVQVRRARPDLVALLEAAESVLDAASTAPGPAARVWVHGDLYPGNLLVHDGRIAAVLDWGDLTSGDPATDVAVAWWWFDGDAWASFWQAYGRPDRATWLRARGWAVFFAAAHLRLGTDASMTRLAEAQLRRVATADGWRD